MISLYCVGIHFRQDKIPFVADPATPGFMKGEAILAYCQAHYGLRYKLTVPTLSPVEGHISYLSYTPTVALDPKPRVTFGGVFPFYGKELSLTEILKPIGEASQVIQYTVQPAPGGVSPVKVSIPGKGIEPISRDNDAKSSFGKVGFPDNCEIRIRSLNIYCTY